MRPRPVPSRFWWSLALALVLALKGVAAAAGLACELAAPATAVMQAPLCHEIPGAQASAPDEGAAAGSLQTACAQACAVPPLSGTPGTVTLGGLPDRDWRERAPLPPASPALAGLERPPRPA